MKGIYKRLVYAISILAFSTIFWSCEETVEQPVGGPPTGEVPAEMKAAQGESVTFTGNFIDVIGLASLSIQNAELGINESMEFPSNKTRHSIRYEFTLAEDAPPKIHDVVYEIKNVSNEVTTVVTKIDVAEVVTYENIYMAGSFQWWPWEPAVAYQMSIDTENEGWFQAPVHCWDDYDELKFLGQTDWNPDNWGLVSQDNPSSGMINDENSEAILLGANGGNPAYKMVRFNPYEKKYSVEDMTEELTPRTEMYIVGKGFTDYPNLDWSPENAIAMTQNPWGYGEHIFLIEGLKFSDDVDLKFIGQNTGWGPYDAGFEVGGEVTVPASWAAIKEGDGSSHLTFKNQAGAHDVLYDYYAKRAIIW
jgi:hypothetical protein